MQGPFHGRTALVIGASGGIGRAIARCWAAQGGSLALVGRDRDALADVARGAEREGVRAEAWVADLADDASVRALPERVRGAFGGLHALVHAAGLYATDDAGPAEMSRLWQVNAHAPLALSQGCRELLRESGGEIVFVNSSIVAGPAPGLAGYAASKRALAAIADSLRVEFNAEGIRVLSVYPGRTATRMQRRVCEREGRAYRPERLLQPEDVASAVVHALLLPRRGEITDLHIRPFRKPD